METSAPVRLLYVGGVPRSGSTLADLMIGQLPGHVGVGELYYLWTDGPHNNVRCACGVPFTGCPFWREVGERAYGGWSPTLVDEVLALQLRVDRTPRIPALVAPPAGSAFARAVTRYTDLLTALYRAIADTSGARVVVDSSKRPSLAFALRGAPGVDLAVAHVVRDPRGVAFSWGKRVADGATHRGDMPRWSPATVSRRWVTVNASVAALRRFGVRGVRVRYEDLVADPPRQLARIAALHGIEVRPADLGFLADGGVRPAATHTIAGSRIRHSDGVLPLRLDEEWRTALPAAQRRFVTAATAVSRWRYGYH
ncbi:MAG TPA: sulfotransferase [Micromonosporaceae bacterium]|nr:sulfotransferase [Micromonosporaceae bacterium]